MREVMISIQPRWIELIASGKKTVEVRKTRPKCETPFKCYIYETKDKKFEGIGSCGYKADGERYNYIFNGGKVIGEFVCDRIIDIPHKDLTENFRRLTHDIITPSCLKVQELEDYLGCKDGYGWHITDLVVYDEPRELGEFAKPAETCYDDDGYLLCDGCEFANWNIERVCTIDFCPERMITRPPQSWQFCVATEPRQTAD